MEFYKEIVRNQEVANTSLPDREEYERLKAIAEANELVVGKFEKVLVAEGKIPEGPTDLAEIVSPLDPTSVQEAFQHVGVHSPSDHTQYVEHPSSPAPDGPNQLKIEGAEFEFGSIGAALIATAALAGVKRGISAATDYFSAPKEESPTEDTVQDRAEPDETIETLDTIQVDAPPDWAMQDQQEWTMQDGSDWSREGPRR